MEHRRTLMMAIGRPRRAWMNHTKSVAHSIGIPESYRVVISYLARSPGANQRMIAEFSNVTTSAINQTVKNMIAEGYVQKETDGCDRRNTKLFLTEKGENVALLLRERLHKSDEVITALITPEKEAEIIAVLDRIYDCLQEESTC